LLDPTVQIVVKELQQREFAVVDSKLKALRHKAIDTMNELLESDMDNVRFQAAKDILDRGGHRPQQTIKVDKTVTTLEQQLKDLADFTIDDADVIDISDIVEEVKNGG
jgi:vacuolar-type H+-ATPase subunit I/STV1